MKKVYGLVLTVIFMISFLSLSTFAVNKRESLKFSENGKFKILQVTDWHTTDQPYNESEAFFEKTLDEYKPDLVVLTGDVVTGGWFFSTPFSVKAAIDSAVAPLDERNIPFVFCFGNHDEETYCPKTYQMNCYRKYSECLVPYRLSYLKGFGDYNILIKDSKNEKNIFNLWLIDSGSRTGFSGSDIVPVSKKQIEWFKKTDDRLTRENGEKIPSVVFQHVPVQEVYTKILKEVPENTPGAVMGGNLFKDKYYILDKTKYISGELNMSVGGGTKNCGEYNSWVEQGNVLAAFFGHDHKNDYVAKTDDGIILGATRTCGFQSRGDGAKRGFRLIVLDENDINNISTQSILYCDVMNTDEYPAEKKEYNKSERLSKIPSYFLNGIVSLFTANGKK